MFVLLSNTGQGNASPEVDNKVRVDLVNLMTYHMEYDICSVSGYALCLAVFNCRFDILRLRFVNYTCC